MELPQIWEYMNQIGNFTLEVSDLKITSEEFSKLKFNDKEVSEYFTAYWSYRLRFFQIDLMHVSANIIWSKETSVIFLLPVGCRSLKTIKSAAFLGSRILKIDQIRLQIDGNVIIDGFDTLLSFLARRRRTFLCLQVTAWCRLSSTSISFNFRAIWDKNFFRSQEISHSDPIFGITTVKFAEKVHIWM